jgi:hypothetical protein
MCNTSKNSSGLTTMRFFEKRKGGSELSGVVTLVVIGAAIWFFFIRPDYRSNIERVLQADETLHSRITSEARFLDVAWDQSGITSRYVQGLHTIDLSACPDEFKQAFQLHIQAWAGYEKVARSNGGFRGSFKGFFTGGAAAIAALSDAADAQTNINCTWREVLRIAEKYDAKLKRRNSSDTPELTEVIRE